MIGIIDEVWDWLRHSHREVDREVREQDRRREDLVDQMDKQIDRLDRTRLSRLELELRAVEDRMRGHS